MEGVWVLVAEHEGGEPIEVDAMEEGIPLSTLRSQFGPDAVRLQYRNPNTNRWRAVTVEGDTMRPPAGGWTEERVYILKRFVPNPVTDKADGEFVQCR